MLRNVMPLVAMCVAIHSCSTPLGTEDATLQVIVHSTELRVRFPLDGSGREVTLINSLDDPRGFAGLELEITGVGPRVTFKAADFADDQPKFRVPDSGAVRFSARLTQGDRVVAEGWGVWTLQPNVEWRFVVSRAPFPPHQPMGLDDIEKGNPPCVWFGCLRNWRFPIMADEANYEYEALWLSLYRYHHDSCGDVACF